MPTTGARARYRLLFGNIGGFHTSSRGPLDHVTVREPSGSPALLSRGSEPAAAQEKSIAPAVTMLFLPVPLARFSAARQAFSSASNGISRSGTRLATPALMVR